MATFSFLWLYLANIQVSICKTIGPLVFDYTCIFLKCVRFIINMNKRFKILTHTGDKPENFDSKFRTVCDLVHVLGTVHVLS